MFAGRLITDCCVILTKRLSKKKIVSQNFTSSGGSETNKTYAFIARRRYCSGQNDAGNIFWTGKQIHTRIVVVVLRTPNHVTKLMR